MAERRFHYVTPLIWPVLPASHGELEISLPIQKVLDSRMDVAYDGPMRIDFTHCVDGARVSEERVTCQVTGGRADPPEIWRRVSHDRLGYLEAAISCEAPVFRGIDVSVGYATLIGRHGSLNLIPDYKYARPIVIEQIRGINRFCLLHPAALIERRRNSGNGCLLVNPYSASMVVSMSAANERSLRRRLAPCHAVLVPLDGLVEDGVITAVMMTANYRFLAWDLRYALDDPSAVNSIDHLEAFRGQATYRSVAPAEYLKAAARRGLEAIGLRAW